MPTILSVMTGPRAMGGAAPAREANAAACSDGAYSGIRIVVPTRTPLYWAIVNEASASSGADWSGIRPATSLTIRGSSAGGTSRTLKSLVSIGRDRQLHEGGP